VSLFRKLLCVDFYLTCVAVLLTVTLAEARLGADCTTACPGPPEGSCGEIEFIDDEDQQGEALMEGCCCAWFICWFYDEAGLCFNSDRDQCVDADRCRE
jgi:hypothetical protein